VTHPETETEKACWIATSLPAEEQEEQSPSARGEQGTKEEVNLGERP